jgi:hypothetical protein
VAGGIVKTLRPGLQGAFHPLIFFTLENYSMKSIQNILGKICLTGLSASLLTMTAGCSVTGNPMGTIGQLLGARINSPGMQAQSEYLYYPQYDVYLNRNTNEFVSLENGRWVTRRAPRNVSTSQVLRSQSISIDGYDSPAHHRSVMARNDPRYGYQPNDYRRTNYQNTYNGNPNYRRY